MANTYTIRAGDNLTKIASQYGTTVQGLQSLNPTITNPNVIMAGASLNVPGAAPAVYSSNPAANQVSGNQSTLMSYQRNFTPVPQTNSSSVGSTTSSKPTVTTPAGTSSAPTGNPLSVTSTNPALQSIIDQANNLIKTSGVQLSPENQALLNQINGIDTDIKSNVADAQTASNNNQYQSLNDYIKQAQELETKRDTAIQELTKQLGPLRDRYMASLAPSALENDLGNQLAGINKKIADFDVSTQEGQLNEFGLGRPLALSTGRAERLGQQAALTRTSYVNEANALLTRLGLAQEARTAESKGLAAGLGFLADDIELQGKAYDRLQTQEQNVFNRFKDLNTIQRQNAADMLESLKGYDPSKLSSEVRTQIAQIAEQRGIPSDAIFAGLQTQFDEQQLNILTKKGDMALQQAQIRNINSQIVERGAGDGDITFSGATKPTKTFEEFIKEKGQELKQSIVNKEKYRPEYEEKYGSGSAVDYSAILNTILGSGKFTKDQAKAVKNSVLNGEDPFTVIKNQAKNIAGATEGRQIANYEIAKQQLQDVESLLGSYYANGGKTSLLKGKYEKVVNKLGEVKDPKLVEIATQISSALQIYRNAVSGTAYSVQEGKDIESIFPGINKSEGLNKAILRGRMAAFDSSIDGSYKAILGNGYEALKKANEPKPTTSAEEPTRVYKGQTYTWNAQRNGWQLQ